MAFSVTPTSGDVPYLLEAQFLNEDNFNGTDYDLFVRVRTTENSCPNIADVGADRPNIASSLLATGAYTENSDTVPVGSCRTYSLIIRHIPSGDAIEVEGVNINNV